MSDRAWKVISYRTHMPYGLLLRFAIPTFVVVFATALLLGAAPFWAAGVAALTTIAAEAAFDAARRRRHESIHDR